jgi:hypothetical protein
LLHSGGGFVWVLVGGMEISMYPLFGWGLVMVVVGVERGDCGAAMDLVWVGWTEVLGLFWLWGFCPVVLERAMCVDTPCWRKLLLYRTFRTFWCGRVRRYCYWCWEEMVVFDKGGDLG